MTRRISWSLLVVALLTSATIFLQDSAARDVARPEEVRSMREVIYDAATYAKLTDLWHQYYKEFPSEFSYANWMYAARYAKVPDYRKLLEKGVKKYPSNPKLLYLAGCDVGSGDDQIRNRERLERAVAIDPHYTDPWFSLVGVYMAADDGDRTNLALRQIYESGIIREWVMDYSYNMLVSLDSNAVLITNGDNDTYPGWILTRILNIRPDVVLVNRSLLNTDWYPTYVIKRGAPSFITPSELKTMRDAIREGMKNGTVTVSRDSPFGDTLIVRLVEAAQREGRPAYFAATLSHSATLDRLAESATNLALVRRVTPCNEPSEHQLRRLFTIWRDQFRTGGLDSWGLHGAAESEAGRKLMPNYAFGMIMCLDALGQAAPELRKNLFEWYCQHSEWVLSEDMKARAGSEWCKQGDVPEIRSWCEKRGYGR